VCGHAENIQVNITGFDVLWRVNILKKIRLPEQRISMVPDE
jgi:hypothetical protein